MSIPTAPFFLLHGPQTWQTFKDDQKSDVFPAISFGTWEESYAELQEQNELGAGIYYCVNETDGTGRKAENITNVRAWYTDIDGIPSEGAKRQVVRRLLEHVASPSCIVETRNGLHAIWYAVPGASIDKQDYRDTEEGIIGYWGGDQSVKDLSRVLRAPTFYHRKRKEGQPMPEPFEIKVVYEDPVAFWTAEELHEHFPKPKREYRTDYDRSKIVFAEDDWGKVVEAVAAWSPIPSARHRVATIACGVALKFGVSETQCVSDLLPIVGNWDTGRDMVTELRRTARWAYQNDPATVTALRNEGVDVPKLSKPDSD